MPRTGIKYLSMLQQAEKLERKSEVQARIPPGVGEHESV